MRYKKGTFVTVPNKDALRGLDPQTQTLFMWLCSYADDDGLCFPSIDTLAQNSGMTRNTVKSRLETLVGLGLLRIERRRNGSGKSLSNCYQIMLVEGSGDDPLGGQEVTGEGSRGDRGEGSPDGRELNPYRYNSNHLTQSKAPALQGEQWNILIDGFKEINPLYESFYRNTTERKALTELTEKLGFEKLRAVVEHLPGIVSQPYAPKITKPTELRRDLGKLILFYKQHNKHVVQI